MQVKVGILCTLVALVVFIIFWGNGSTQREAESALNERLHGDVIINARPLLRRGILCGSYRLAPSAAEPFVYVSHYSGEGDRARGVHLAADADFADLNSRLCSGRQQYEVPIAPDKPAPAQVSRKVR
jgi:hypothetical protein